MPTLPGRDELRARAIASLVKQFRPEGWELILYRDYDPKPTLGAKLNRMLLGCKQEYVVLIDDDDWHSPHRVRRQVEPLLNGYDLTGTSQIYYQDGREAWLYKGNGSWLGGMAFKRSLWERLPFEDISQGVDANWQTSLLGIAKSYDIADPALFVATIHAANTCKKDGCTNGPNWTPVDFNMVMGLMNA